MLKIFADTDIDILPDLAKEYDVRLISMPFIFDDQLYYPYKNEDTFDFHSFYEKLRNGKMASTCALNVEDYINYFEPVFQNGDDILYIHFSAAMTATFTFMDEALKQLKEKYPERKFYQIDTLGITIAGYIVFKEILIQSRNGLSGEELVKWANENVQHYACYFFADDLKFFKRSGRVSGIAAMFGGLIGIRPLLTMNSEGKMESIGKVKGRINAVEELVNYVDKLGDDIKNHTFVIGHADDLPLANELANRLKEKYGDDLNIEYVCVNPTTGAHCGPNTIGVAFHAIHK